MDLFELVRLVRRRWPVIAAAVVVGLVAGWVTAPGDSDQPSGYAATTTLLTNPRSTTQLNLQQAALLATTGDVPVAVADQLDLESDDVVKGSVDATASDETSAISIRATRPDPETAEAVSLAVAETLIDFISGGDQSAYEQQIEDLAAAVEQYRTQVDVLSATTDPGGATDPGRLAELQAAQGQLAAALSSLQQLRTQGPPPAPLLVVEEGEAREVVPEGVRAPDSKPARALLLGGFGLLVGMGAVIALDRLDTRIRSKEIAEAAYGTRVLAEIPPLPDARKRSNELLAVTDPSSPFVEAYRSLRTVVALDRADEDLEAPRAAGGRVLLITSPGPGEGKTTTTAHLAATLAEIGRSVLVVSADFRRPRLHVLFGVPREPGLSEMLDAGSEAPNLRDLVRSTAVDGVRLLPSGAPTKHPATVLRGADRLLTAARTIFDYVLVDTAPMLVANDAAELVRSCDGVLLMARAGRTSIAAAQRTADVLDQLEAPVLGCVLIATTNSATAYSYYRYRYYEDSAKA